MLNKPELASRTVFEMANLPFLKRRMSCAKDGWFRRTCIFSNHLSMMSVDGRQRSSRYSTRFCSLVDGITETRKDLSGATLATLTKEMQMLAEIREIEATVGASQARLELEYVLDFAV